MADSTTGFTGFPNFNIPGLNFPFPSLPAQASAAFAPQQFTDGSQYGRWNGVNNNAFGLFPNQFGPLFGYQPQGGNMQFQPPYGNMTGGYQGQMPQIPSGQMPQLPSGQMPTMQPQSMQGGISPQATAGLQAWGQATGQDMSSSIASTNAFQQALARSRQPAQTALDPNFNGNIMDVPWDQLGNFRTTANPGAGPLSIRFTTPGNMGANSSFQFVQTPGQQEAMRLATLSTQPGMFGTGAGGNTQLSAAPYFNFTVGNGAGQLSPNTTYYLNLANRNSYGGPDIFGNNYGVNVDYQHGGNG